MWSEGKRGVWAKLLDLSVPVVQAEACLWCASELLEISLLVVTSSDFLRCYFASGR